MIVTMRPLEKLLIFWGGFWGVLGLGYFLLGLLGLWYRPVIIGAFLILFLLLIWYGQKQRFFQELLKYLKNIFKIIYTDKVILFLVIFFVIFAGLNLFAALAPEVGFDALWYHLTLPKIYLATHHIKYLTGGLYYYSVMPRLVEMFYGFGLAISSSGMVAKLIHYSFGLAWFGGCYIFLRLFLSRRLAVLGGLVAYTTALVGNLSQTAYIDLAVAFYAAMAFWAFFSYLEGAKYRSSPKGENYSASQLAEGLNFSLRSKNIFLLLSAIFLGFVLAGKLYGLMLLPIMILILLFKGRLKGAAIFAGLALLIASPFYLQAYFTTGNPLYPLFSVPDNGLNAYLNGYQTLSEWYRHVWALKLPGLLWRVTVFDFTPVLALGIFGLLNREYRKVLIPALIFLLFFIFWSLQPMWEPRYFIAILPILILLALWGAETIKFKPYQISFWTLAILAIGLNFAIIVKADSSPIRAVFNREYRTNYLAANLPTPLNYLDQDSSFKNIINNSQVLTADIHNLFYADFPFTDYSTIENRGSQRQRRIQIENESERLANFKKLGYDYILIGETDKPSLIITNLKPILEKNNFKLYRLP